MMVNCLVFTELSMSFEFHNEQVAQVARMVLPYG